MPLTPHRRPLGLVATLLVLAALACNTLAGPRPTVAWDTDPAATVLYATFCCGMVPMSIAQNYVPEVQIWGDGRIVWSVQNNSGARDVYTGQLTSTQLSALLQKYVDAGFFGWDTNYGDYSITDGASQCVSVNLTSVSHQVCEYFRGAPAAFHGLYADAANGAGAVPTAYAPTLGYVTAYPQTLSQPPSADQYLNWPVDSLGVSLANLSGGAYLEGEALDFAWRVVNTHIGWPIVREGDVFYELTVIVPGLSLNVPPVPTPTPAAP